MFRTNKTAKRVGAKKNNNVSGPITPASASASAPAPATTTTLTAAVINDVSGGVLEAIARQETPPVEATAAAAAVASPGERNSNLVSTETMLSALLDAESKAAVFRPWLRLERGLRMRLLRAYVEKQKEMTVQERVDLLVSLVEALDKKLLNSKSQITYNPELGAISEINALKIIHPASGKTVFRIEPPHRSTKKARRPSGGSDSE